MTKTYRVTWAIDIDADSPRDAAQIAQEIQRDKTSTATVFDVSLGGTSEQVDLLGRE